MDQDILIIHVAQEALRTRIDLIVHLDLMLDMDENIIIRIHHPIPLQKDQEINQKEIIKVILQMMKTNSLRNQELTLLIKLRIVKVKVKDLVHQLMKRVLV
jgi:dTDP-4-amino-4,6-dideoxygalactose transaminase